MVSEYILSLKVSGSEYSRAGLDARALDPRIVQGDHGARVGAHLNRVASSIPNPRRDRLER